MEEYLGLRIPARCHEGERLVAVDTQPLLINLLQLLSKLGIVSDF